MADSIATTSSAGQILSNYEKYKDFFAEDTSTELGQNDFLSLMVEQMKNQDYLNPTDSSEYMAQLAQFSLLSEIQAMSQAATATYATSLVGKTVAVKAYDASGNLVQEIGTVSSVKMDGEQHQIIVNGQAFTTSNILQVFASEDRSSSVTDNKKSSDEEVPKVSDEDVTEVEEEEAPDYSQGIF